MNEYLQLLLNAFFVGLGSAVGNYLATTHLIKKIEKGYHKARKKIMPDKKKIKKNNKKVRKRIKRKGR